MDIKDFQKKLAQVKKELQKELDKGEILKDIGDSMVDQIKARTSKGFGVEKNNTSKKKLKELKPLTKISRTHKKKRGKLSSSTTPNKSNLTESGDMIDSLEYSINNNVVTVEPNSKLNKDKTKWNADKGRSYLFLSKPEIRKIKELFEDALDKIIKKLK